MMLLTLSSSGARGAMSEGTCQNVGKLAKIFAQARDNGVSINDLSLNIEKMSKTQGSSDFETMSVKSTAYSIYTDKMSMTPDRVGSYYYTRCLKNSGN